METSFLEHCVVELKTEKRNILLVSAYRPPNTKARTFLTEYKRLLNSLKKNKGHEIIIGLEHNLDLLKSHLNQLTNDFMELKLDRELIPYITKATRITSSSASLIDNILISRSLQKSYDSFVLIEDISDHFACLVILKDQNKSTKGPRYMKTRNLDDHKINDIVSCLQDNKWMETLSELDANKGFDIFHLLLIETIDKIAPETEIKLSKGRTAKDPWITKGILNSIRKQKKLYLEQLLNNTTTAKYKAYRNQLQKIIRKAKTSYFREKCKEYKQNSHKLWKLIQEILNKTPNKGESIKAINIDGVPSYDPQPLLMNSVNTSQA